MRSGNSQLQIRSGYEEGLDYAGRPHWHSEAACRGRSDWFDARLNKGDSLAAHAGIAARIQTCESCPVRASCAYEALTQGAQLATGVWAGIWTGTRNSKARRLLVAIADREAPQRSRIEVEHGTRRGYKQHLYRNQDPCDECRVAYRIHTQTDRPSRAKAG